MKGTVKRATPLCFTLSLSPLPPFSLTHPTPIPHPLLHSGRTRPSSTGSVQVVRQWRLQAAALDLCLRDPRRLCHNVNLALHWKKNCNWHRNASDNSFHWTALYLCQWVSRETWSDEYIIWQIISCCFLYKSAQVYLFTETLYFYASNSLDGCWCVLSVSCVFYHHPSLACYPLLLPAHAHLLRQTGSRE